MLLSAIVLQLALFCLWVFFFGGLLLRLRLLCFFFCGFCGGFPLEIFGFWSAFKEHQVQTILDELTFEVVIQAEHGWAPLDRDEICEGVQAAPSCTRHVREYLLLAHLTKIERQRFVEGHRHEEDERKGTPTVDMLRFCDMFGRSTI